MSASDELKSVPKPTHNPYKDHVYDFSDDEQYNRQGPHHMKELTEKDGFVLDIRYATTNNFTGEKIYDTGRCFLHNQMAARIKQAQKFFNERGVGIKLFDCYRPRPAQVRLWNAFPDPNFVGRPTKKTGSFHNKGCAVDLTLVDSKTGEQLDMGTPFDFFGEKGYSTCTDLPDHVLTNRRLLQKGLTKFGLVTIPREWWHFNLVVPGSPLCAWEWK